ncbi:ROK family protein [Isoptericola sp. NEAU-Y5]|uniref:ROK family protein n=1 Tax=Isoptericola luteus TaxID=2879484 RepID=A0ABS7ZLJ1_9MICO|nr:ROK family protein [Isoptericola sp. NEAU-Y5]MCA5894519.1 ROK family protein [Isoptericola sp. NEAU-Y5]
MDTSSATTPAHDPAAPPGTRADGAPGEQFGLGLEVARDRVRVALVDGTGKVRARAERRDVQRTPAARARAAAVLAHSCSEDVEARLGAGKGVRIRHAVAAFPSVVAPDQASVYRVPGFEKGGTALRDALSDALGCPVDIENDANLAAIAEHQLGAAVGRSSFVSVLLGEGFGAGIVLDGRLHRGAAGMAGEVAFVPQPGRALGTQVLGDVALAALAKEHGLPENLSLREVLDRDEAGDRSAGEVAEEVARRTGVMIATMTLVLDPALFVLGDQAARPGVHDRVTSYLRDQIAVLPVRVEASTLGSDAVVLGAACAVSEVLR